MIRYCCFLFLFGCLWVADSHAEGSEQVNLSAALAKRAQLSETQAQEQVERVFSIIRAELKAGHSVDIRNFGNFSVRERTIRRGKAAPGGQQKPSVEKRKYPNFVSDDSLKAELNSPKTS